MLEVYNSIDTSAPCGLSKPESDALLHTLLSNNFKTTKYEM